MSVISNTFYKLGDWFGGTKNAFYRNTATMIGQKGAVFIDVDKPNELYHTIPQLRTIIGKKKAMFANVDPVLVNKEGKQIKGAKADEFYKLIYNPNPLQSMNAWLENQIEHYDIYGNQFIFKNHVSGTATFPETLWNISPRYMTPYLSGKVFKQLRIEDIILHYDYNDGSNKDKYDTSSILYTKHNDLDNPVLGCSPLKSMKHPLSNIDGAYKYRNVIITNKGAIGILSNRSKDNQGVVPMTEPEKKRIQDQYLSSYGINEDQMKVILTEASLEWTAMSYPTKDMMLFEEVDEGTMILIDLYGMNINLFAKGKATYENVKNSIKQVYSDTIQPLADLRFQAISKFLDIEQIFGKGAYIKPSYEHIKILQEDKKEGAELFKFHVESISELVTSGILTSQQGTQALISLTGFDFTKNTNE